MSNNLKLSKELKEKLMLEQKQKLLDQNKSDALEMLLAMKASPYRGNSQVVSAVHKKKIA